MIDSSPPKASEPSYVLGAARATVITYVPADPQTGWPPVLVFRLQELYSNLGGMPDPTELADALSERIKQCLREKWHLRLDLHLQHVDISDYYLSQSWLSELACALVARNYPPDLKRCLRLAGVGTWLLQRFEPFLFIINLSCLMAENQSTFFQDLAGIAQGKVNFTLVVAYNENGTVTVGVVPTAQDTRYPMFSINAPNVETLDAEFFGRMQAQVQPAVQVLSNAGAFTEQVKQVAKTTQAKRPAKPAAATGTQSEHTAVSEPEAAAPKTAAKKAPAATTSEPASGSANSEELITDVASTPIEATGDDDDEF